MEYANFTPFPTLCFETIWPDKRESYTIVARATAEIIPDDRLRLAEEQLPLNVTDVYFGKPGASSLRYPNDLSPFKPRADIILNATAYNPDKASSAFSASVKVGDLEKKIIVTGPIIWAKGLTGWRLTHPRPVEKQPIRYESAFGGDLKYTDEKGDSKIIDVYQYNPVGRGWQSKLADKLVRNLKYILAPQIYSYTAEKLIFGKEYPPEGFGAIASSWLSRRKHAGSWTAPAEGEEMPPYPSDFNQSFYNSAHSDLIRPYLTGDEKVELINLTSSGKLNFQLPGHSIYVTAQYEGNENEETIPANMDTLIIEPDEMRVGMVWRATLPVAEEIVKIGARMIFNEQIDKEAKGVKKEVRA